MGRWKRNKEQVLADIEAGSKVCCICEERKDFSEFYNFTNKNDGKSYRCKVCDTLARKKNYLKDVDRYKGNSRRRQLKFRFGLTDEDYNAILEEQNNACAICGKLAPVIATKKEHSLSVDHCHTTGRIRGLLCNQCNRGIGMLGDTEAALERALSYLRNTH